jgi:predicted Fe-Mo cluster-binding NifX family protein
MILFISAQRPQLDSPIDNRFGRSAWLISIETDSMKWDAFSNPGESQAGGAGVAAAQFVINQKASMVISGDFGPHAAKALQAAGVKMNKFPESTKTVSDVLLHFAQGAN